MEHLVGRVWSPGLRHAGLCGLFLALLVIPPFALIQQMEASKPTHLRDAWDTLSEGMPVSIALERMGPADSVQDVHQAIPSQLAPRTVEGTSPSPSAHASPRTCVKQYEWLEDPKAPSTRVFSVCTDAEGTILIVSTGMTFDLVVF